MSCGCNSTDRYTIVLNNIDQLNQETFSFDFKSKEEFTWKEGDSSKLYIGNSEGEMGKVFSYATLPEEGIIRFTTRIREERSDYKDILASIEIGDELTITPPKGEFTLRREKRPIIIASNGVGIAATRALIKSYDKNPADIPKLISLNVDRNGDIYKHEFRTIMNNRRSFMPIYVSNRETYYSMLDHELQRMIHNDPYIYAVGSTEFVIDTVNHLKDMGIDEESIITEGHVFGGCGCSSEDGCGCGSNLVSIEYNESSLFNVVKAS